MQKVKRFLRWGLIAVGMVAFFLLFSISFSKQRYWTTIWFLGDKYRFGFHGPLFTIWVEALIYFASSLLGIVLLRQIPVFSELPNKWRHIVTYLSLALLGTLSAYGVLVSSMAAAESPEGLLFVYKTHWLPLAATGAAAVFVFLWDLLAPRVRKSMTARREKAPRRADRRQEGDF